MEKEKSFEQVLSELVEKDLINEPDHYKGQNGMEVIDVIKILHHVRNMLKGSFSEMSLNMFYDIQKRMAWKI